MPSAVSPVFSYRLPRRINQAAPLLDGKNKHRQLSAGGQAAIQPKQRNKATHTHTHTQARAIWEGSRVCRAALFQSQPFELHRVDANDSD